MVRNLFILLMILPVSAAAFVNVSTPDPTESHFSPNGDGIKDFMGVSFNVQSDQETVLIWISVNDEDGNAVKTIITAAPRQPGTVHELWDGTADPSGIASEGFYTFQVRAVADSYSDADTSAKFVLDVTPPGFEPPLIEPKPYTPALPYADSLLTIEVRVLDSQPDDWLQVWVLGPDKPETLRTAKLVDGDTVYTSQWDGHNVEEMEDTVWIRTWDEAGNRRQKSYPFYVDNIGPRMKFTYPEKAWLDSVPTSVAGWVFDQGDVDSIGLRFSQDSEYGPVSTTSGKDTLAWYADWPADLQHGGTFNLQCFASDSIGYETVKSFVVYVDTTAPKVPVLVVPDYVSSPLITLSGTSSANDSVFVRRVWQGATRDSVGLLATAAGGFEASFDLDIGKNLFRAFARDRAGNRSAWSDTAIAVYGETMGITVPERWGPGTRIDANFSRPASEVTLRVFSVDGYYIATHTWRPEDLYNEFEVEPKDDDGKDVRNGLYLFVFEIRFADGSTSTEKMVVVASR
jgi:hypothetical protein